MLRLCVVIFALFSVGANAAPIKPPPPTNPKYDQVAGVDANHGSVIFEWTPAISPTGTPYRAYVLSSVCTYQSIPSGGQTKVTDGAQWEYTGPPYKVLATCKCRYGTQPFPIMTQKPTVYDRRSDPAYFLPRFQIPCKK